MLFAFKRGVVNRTPHTEKRLGLPLTALHTHNDHTHNTTHTGEKELDDLIWYYDEPIQFVNSVLLSHLCRQIKQNKQKVAWSGEGSDEIFYGYNRFINSSNLFSIKDNQDSKIGNIYYGGGLHSLPIIDKLTNKKEIANEKELDAWAWLRKNVDKDFDILQQMYLEY